MAEVMDAKQAISMADCGGEELNVCVRACVCACVRGCVGLCVCVYMCVCVMAEVMDAKQAISMADCGGEDLNGSQQLEKHSWREMVQHGAPTPSPSHLRYPRVAMTTPSVDGLVRIGQPVF